MRCPRRLRGVLSGDMARFTYEYPCHAPDVRRWFLVTITTLEPDTGSGAVVMHFDISARVLAQERAEQWRTRLGSVINEAQVGILVHRQFQPLLANRENALISGMRDTLARVLGEHIHVRVRCAAGIPAVRVDPGQLEDAILNLSLNARDAMPEGGELNLQTELADIRESDVIGDLAPGRYMTVSVEDTGTGMEAVTLSRAFEPFFSTKEVGKGSGLGLSMIFGFVSQTGGHVQIRSEVNVGTCATLHLPCEPPPLVG